jgi:hypothetical protein
VGLTALDGGVAVPLAREQAQSKEATVSNAPQVPPYPTVERMVQRTIEATSLSERTVRKVLAFYITERGRLLGERADALRRRELWEFEATKVVPGIEGNDNENHG